MAEPTPDTRAGSGGTVVDVELVLVVAGGAVVGVVVVGTDVEVVVVVEVVDDDRGLGMAARAAGTQAGTATNNRATINPDQAGRQPRRPPPLWSSGVTGRSTSTASAWLVAGVIFASCATPAGSAAHHPSRSAVTSTTTTVAPATTAPAPTTTAVPVFAGAVATVTTAQLPYTYRPGCPVAPDQLRMLTMSYWGFDGTAHTGTMVVNASVAQAVLTVFHTLYDERFPIRQMEPEDAFQGSDPASMAADNTSGFNCRDAVAPGPPQWSVHAYGEAIDVNPVENPYIEGGAVQPTAGAAFVDRANVRPGMAELNGELNNAFADVGWLWGGRWTGSPDYQHFSSTGN